MKSLLPLVGLALLCASCASSGPTLTPKLAARGTVETIETAWLSSAATCLEIAKAKQDDTIRAKCAAIFSPARAQLIAASAMVDGWTDADASNVACAIQDLLVTVREETNMLADLQVKIPQVVADASQLGAFEAQFCHRQAPVAGRK